MSVRFSLGVNYWPRRTASGMWRSFDRAEIANDFAHIAALGLDGVRIFLRWDEFQPTPDALDLTMLDRFETVVTLAHEAGLSIVPVLFCGHVAGVNYLPAWAIDSARPAKRFRTVTADTISRSGAADIYGAHLRTPQLLFARTVAQRVRAHPGIRAWDLGNAFANVREPVHRKLSTGDHSQEPAGEREMAAWSADLARALRESSASRVTIGAHVEDLARDRDARLGSLCAPLDFCSIGGLGVENPFARHRLDVEAVPFLAALTAAFSMKPVLVTGFGNPSCPPDKFSAFERFALPGEPPNVTIAPEDTVFATYPCASDDDNAAYCTATLERLHADGRLGAYWWSWSDYPEAIRNEPPYDLAPHEAVCGILRDDGSEKPVARALRAFAARNPRVLATNDMPMIAAAYYYRTLPKSAKTLFDAYLRRIDATRPLPPSDNLRDP